VWLCQQAEGERGDSTSEDAHTKGVKALTSEEIEKLASDTIRILYLQLPLEKQNGWPHKEMQATVVSAIREAVAEAKQEAYEEAERVATEQLKEWGSGAYEARHAITGVVTAIRELNRSRSQETEG
jgi:hypothetical protein